MNTLSIITINYNNSDGLQRTIESIAAQTCKNFEYIVVDGGSTDGSLDIIKANESHISKWISEPDTGIYNAMNKGAQMACGEFITFVNSGDELSVNTIIEKVLPQLQPETDIYFGQVLDILPDGKENLYKFNREISLMSLYRDVVNHAGTFIKRQQQLNRPYNEILKICSDRQFFIESIILDNCSYKHLDDVIVRFDKTGISSGNSANELMMKENEIILNNVVPPRIACDYKKSNLMLQDLTSELVQFHGVSKLIVKLDLILLKLYKSIKH